MARHFSQLFWGLLIVFLGFSINGFDLLMDGVGYLVAAAGCRGLTPLSHRFAVSRNLCFTLAALWLVGHIVPRDLAFPQAIAVTIAVCAMFWQLLGGIAEFALSRERPDLSERALNRRVAYVVMMPAVPILSLAIQESRGAPSPIIALAIAALVMQVMILHLIHQVKTALAT